MAALAHRWNEGRLISLLARGAEPPLLETAPLDRRHLSQEKRPTRWTFRREALTSTEIVPRGEADTEFPSSCSHAPMDAARPSRRQIAALHFCSGSFGGQAGNLGTWELCTAKVGVTRVHGLRPTKQGRGKEEI
jgi:hypothetical protein